jgi:N-acetylglucosamine kinase-like BadF-type ATPase
MRAVLGVDGGNTKTVALVAGEDGRVLGRGRSGCSDIYGAESAAAALRALDDATAAALRAAGLRPSDLSAAVFSLAGADWPEDFHFLRCALRDRGLADSVIILNDAFAPLRAGSDDFTGVSVVCGTGAAIGARSASGQMWHASWWLNTHGARQLGQRALEAVIAADLGIAPPTRLTAGLLSVYGAESVEDLLHRITKRVGGVACPERAAPILVGEAERGDAVARGIAEDHGRRLGSYALAAARRVDLAPLHRLVLAGTVLERSSVIAEALRGCVHEEQPEAEVSVPDLIPAAGAVMLALESAGLTVSSSVRDRLRSGQLA